MSLKVPSEELASEQRDPLWQHVRKLELRTELPHPHQRHWHTGPCPLVWLEQELLSGRLLGIRLRLRKDPKAVSASTEVKERASSLHHRLEVEGMSGQSGRWPSASGRMSSPGNELASTWSWLLSSHCCEGRNLCSVSDCSVWGVRLGNLNKLKYQMKSWSLGGYCFSGAS